MQKIFVEFLRRLVSQTWLLVTGTIGFIAAALSDIFLPELDASFLYLLIFVLGLMVGCYLTFADLYKEYDHLQKKLIPEVEMLQLTFANDLFEELNSNELVSARRWVFSHLVGNSEEDFSKITSTTKGRDAIKLCLNSLDRVSFLTENGKIPDEMIMPWINPMVVKLWDKLRYLVEREAARRGEPDYYAGARRFAQKCTDWRNEKMLSAKILYIKDAI